MIRELRSNDLCLWVDPNYGACLLGFTWRGLNIMPDRRLAPRLVSTLISARGELPEASFIMVPWSGRVFEGWMRHGDTEVLLARPEEHSLHGEVWDQIWTVNAESESFLRCSIEQPLGSSFPARYQAVYEVNLSESRVTQTLTITNKSTTSCFLGGGFHPYFSRLGGPVITFESKGEYPTLHHIGIPSGAIQNTFLSESFSKGCLLSRERPIDASFLLGAKGARVDWPHDGLSAKFEFSDSMTHLVIYSPNDPWFALEPVSHANNILGESQNSGRTLVDPGSSIRLGYTIDIEESSFR